MPRKRAKSPQQEMRVMLRLSPGVIQCFFAGKKQPSLGEREPRFRAVGRTGPLLLFLLVWGLAAIPLREIGDNLLVGRWQGELGCAYWARLGMESGPCTGTVPGPVRVPTLEILWDHA